MDPISSDTMPQTIHHPNAARWRRAREAAVERGRLVCELIEAHMPLHGAVVLDAGCGVGGTTQALCERGADVIAVDRDAARLLALEERGLDVETLHSDIASLPYPDDSFDAIVLQDVLEHVRTPEAVLRELARVLTPDGVLYLSTPNRFSVVNLISDPHFGLPFAALHRRERLRATLRRFRPADAERDDLAQLLSFRELMRLLQRSGFECSFVNSGAARALFEQPHRVVWSSMHLRAVRLLKRSGLHHAALRLVRDEAGMFNSWINPTWHVLCRKARR